MFETYHEETASTHDRIAWVLCQIIDDDAPLRWTRHRFAAECIAHNEKLMADLKMLGKPPMPSIADFSDDELLRRVVRSLVRKRRPKSLVAWAPVAEAFSMGSTYAAQVCRRFGLDPDTGAELVKPNVQMDCIPNPPGAA